MGDPIKITDSQATRLIEYIEAELALCEREVWEPLQARRDVLDDLYYGKVKPRREKWMSNFPVLMGATFVDSITARLLNTTFAYKPTWSLQPTRDSGWTQVARTVEEFLDYKVRTEMRLYNESRKAFFECTRLGAGVLLTPWIERTEEVAVKRLFWNQRVPMTVQQGVVCQHLPLRDFMFPGGYSELDECPWWSRRMHWNVQILREQKARKYYENVDAILARPEPIEQATADALERAGEEPYSTEAYHGHEIWIKWDLDKPGEYLRYVVTYHPGTRKIMRVEEDTYPRWPISLFRYGVRDAGLLGLGVIETTAPFDDALYALYNTLVDNFKIATTQVFKGKKGAGLRADTKVYPAKLFLLNHPDDLQAMSMGQPYALNPAFTRAIWELGERRAGVSDYSLGRESPIAGGKATATGTLALIQEGQRRYDLVIRDIREEFDSLGMFNLRLIHNRMPREIPYMVMGEKGQWIERFLEQPGTEPHLSLSVISSMSSVAMNKEVKKQDAMATMQVLQQFYQQMVQLTTMMAQAPPALGQVLMNIAEASAKKVSDLLTTYGEMSPETYTDIMAPLAGGGAPEGGAPEGGEGGGF